MLFWITRASNFNVDFYISQNIEESHLHLVIRPSWIIDTSSINKRSIDNHRCFDSKNTTNKQQQNVIITKHLKRINILLINYVFTITKKKRINLTNQKIKTATEKQMGILSFIQIKYMNTKTGYHLYPVHDYRFYHQI